MSLIVGNSRESSTVNTTAMRTSVILPILLLTLSTACAPDPAQPDSRPDFDRVELDELADDEEDEETGDAGEGTRPVTEGCCTCVDGLPVCELWSSAPPLFGQATCAGTFVDSCDLVDGELLCPVDC